MTDEEILFEGSLRDWLNKSLVVLASRWPHTEAPPAEFTEWIRELQPSAATVNAAMDRLMDQLGGLDYVIRRNQQTVAVIEAKPFSLPVPTPKELSETETDLRSRVLRETSEQELQQAIREIPDDPEKLKLVAFLKGAIDQATGVRGSSPWIVFVLVFYVCLKINPDPVTSLGTALAVVALMQAGKPGG